MATNFYFNNTEAQNEINLTNELVVEVIQNHGVDVFYMPRTLMNPDYLLMEDPISKFTQQYMIEAYVKSYGGFEGQGDIITKFNLELRDELVLVMSRERFSAEIGDKIGIPRPNEGDLVYFPPSHDFFEIKFVEHESVFYQHGALYSWEIRLEKFEYSSERVETGIEEIDDEFKEVTYDNMSQVLTTSNGQILTTDEGTQILYSPLTIETNEALSQNKIIQEEAEPIFDFTQPNPYIAKP